MSSALIPPAEMLYDGSSSPEHFAMLGENFCRDILIRRARIADSAAILDLGCGNGAVARALTQFLSSAGRYEGIDINLNSIIWLQDHYKDWPNFHFQHADVYNKMYNPAGRTFPSAYKVPFPDSTFGAVFLKSVFTHMLPSDVYCYLTEVSRVLRPGGTCVITYFLLNDESRTFIDLGMDTMSLKHTYSDDPSCRIANPEIPEITVAHDEHRIRQYYSELGLNTVEIAYGSWCRRYTLLGLQDLIIAMRE